MALLSFEVLRRKGQGLIQEPKIQFLESAVEDRPGTLILETDRAPVESTASFGLTLRKLWNKLVAPRAAWEIQSFFRKGLVT